ncbi:MAG: hypothetical protein IAF38_15610, partial [Bacteroidia bacterium]|nr:hypothetical protein [Bacteroidia bacterium]
KFVCKLRGIEDSWYSTPQKRIETPQRIIQSNPVEVYGAIKYKVVSKTAITSELYNSAGELMFSFKGKNEMEPGTWDYNFHLKVEGFEKGKYHVKLKSGSTEIMDKEFAI